MISVILAIIIVFFGVFPFFISFISKVFLIKIFNKNNVIVFGKKGTGKDLLFQYVINSRHKKHFSNIKFNRNTSNICLKDLELKNNTYDNFINNDIFLEEKKEQFEGKDFYISDIGIMLPSQYDTKLYKSYPSFPIFYALSRHLYNSNVHCNTQNLNRVWKALREQADTYIKCIGVDTPFFLGLFGFLRINFIIYDKYESAEKSLLPLPYGFMNKFLNANAKQYYATNGDIKKCYVLINKKSIHYDTRAFHEVVFGYKFKKTSKHIFESLKTFSQKVAYCIRDFWNRFIALFKRK